MVKKEYSEECPCVVTGGYPKGFTISCETNKDRDEAIMKLINELPRFTKIAAGSRSSFVVEDDRIEKEAMFELEVVGHLIHNHICWKSLEERRPQAAVRARQLAEAHENDPMID